MKKNTFNFLLCCTVLVNSTFAQNYQRDPKSEKLIENQLEQIDPSLVPIFKKGTFAMDNGKATTADSLYTLVLESAPNFDPVLRRLGSIKVGLGKRNDGIQLAKKAIDINPSAYNLSNLAYIYSLEENGAEDYLSQKLLREAMGKPNGDDVDILGQYVQVSFNLDDFPSAKEGFEKLKEKHPNAMYTHYYATIFNANAGEWRAAKDELMLAKAQGLDPATVELLMNQGIRYEVNKSNAILYFGVLVAIWILGLLLLFVFGKIFSRFTLRSIENNSTNTEAENPGGWLLKGYKFLINLGGIYYYISLPVILALVLGLAGGLIYLFVLAGTIPIQITLLIIVGAAITVYSLIRSLLVKAQYSDPGRELKRAEAPDLFYLTDKVAKEMGTRAIDEIRITPLDDLAVYEKGSRRQKKRDEAQRILILGTAVVDGFKVTDFKAVLAHEYGHFTHRDTAGGEVAMRVNRDMTNYFIALHNAGQATNFNVAFHFLRLYHFIFRRISHGATRLQEVLADKVAAEKYGTPAFTNGLTHVIRRSLEFHKFANIEIENASETKRKLSNLYELKSEEEEKGTIEEELQKTLNSETNEDDTHPSPKDRFRYLANVKYTRQTENDVEVKSMFTDWDGLTTEMTLEIEKNLQ